MPEPFDNFLRHGVLPPLRFGQRPEEVKSLLGEPRDVSANRKAWGKGRGIWKYGMLELTFRSLRLSMMGITFTGKEALPEAVACPLPVSRETGRTVFIAYCEARGIPWTSAPHLGSPTAIRTGANVSVHFEDEPSPRIMEIFAVEESFQ